jgi:sugar phosphate isomerase/epimerase
LLNDLAAHANHVGCSLNLIVSAFSAERIRQLLAKVKTGPVRITFDPATAVMTGSKPVSVYRDLYQQIGYVRARDALKDVDGAGVEVAVGDGTVDWLQLFPTFVEAEYAGWICVERTGGDHRREDVARGVSKLKKLIPESGD